jgi:hypothetical protein
LGSATAPASLSRSPYDIRSSCVRWSSLH